MTTIVTPSIGRAEDLFKSFVWDNIVTAALTSLGLNFWPLNSILRFISTKIFDQIRLAFDLSAIVFLNQLHKDAFDREMVKLKIVAVDHGIDSEEFKKAKEDAKAVLAKFVAYNR